MQSSAGLPGQTVHSGLDHENFLPARETDRLLSNQMDVLGLRRTNRNIETGSLVMKSSNPHLKIIAVEVLSFGLIICVSWANETLAFAQRIWGESFSTNWHEALLETCVVILVAVPTVGLTWKIVKRLHYLEGFSRICAWCGKVGEDEEWLTTDEFFKKAFLKETSHGICPACADSILNKQSAPAPVPFRGVTG